MREQQLFNIENRTNQLKKELGKKTREELIQEKFKKRENPFAGE